MSGLSASQLLNIWERGLEASFIQKAIIILAAACPDKSVNELSMLSIGDRDALLVDVQENNFGHVLACTTECPGCGEKLEMNIRSDDLRPPMPGPVQDASKIKKDEYEIIFRLPNSFDLNAASGCIDLNSARELLIERCILESHRSGQSCISSEMPQIVIDAISTRMEEMDPYGNLQIDLICPSCGLKWLRLFDIVQFLWSEVDAWARRMLREVHFLASSYGWSEADILAMSRWRRQAYLEMIG